MLDNYWNLCLILYLVFVWFSVVHGGRIDRVRFLDFAFDQNIAFAQGQSQLLQLKETFFQNDCEKIGTRNSIIRTIVIAVVIVVRVGLHVVAAWR